MSQWTHVHGVVRVDSFIGLMMDGSVEGAIRQAVSCPPSGSEGPLKVTVTATREGSELSWGFFTVTGDLRDFGLADVDGIEKWLRGAIQGIQARACIIRDFVVACNVEYGPIVIFFGDHDKFEKVVRDRPKEGEEAA